MTKFRGFASLVLAAAIVSTLSAETHCPGNVASVPICLINRHQMIVDVSVNHSSPYRFLLDTGTQITLVDPSLANELKLSTWGRAEVASVGVHASASFAQLDQLDVGSHSVTSQKVLVYDLQNHFRSREIRVISGYRTPRRRSSSNHGKGRAIDLVVPGSSDADVAAYARTLGFVGVGIYPTSGFVHVDVRERSYFWSDSSGPGRRNRERGILGDLAQSSDRAALARGVVRPPSFTMLLDVDAALRARGAASTEVVEEEDLESEESP